MQVRLTVSVGLHVGLLLLPNADAAVAAVTGRNSAALTIRVTQACY